MFTFNFTFHVPNPFSMSTLTSVANAATDAFNSVATDIREDPELLNYMVAGLGPGGVAGGIGYDPNRLVKPPPPPQPPSFTSPPSSASPKSRGPRGRHTVGLGLANHHPQNRKRHLPAHERNNRPDSRGSTSGFVYVQGNSPPGSGTPKFPTQTYSQPTGNHGPVQGVPVRNLLNHDPLWESRNRGWMPALSEPSCPSTTADFTTGFFDTPKYPDVNEMGGVASIPGFGFDGCELSGMGSNTGDRRKRDEGEGENESMDAGESRVSTFPLFHSSPFAFSSHRCRCVVAPVAVCAIGAGIQFTAGTCARAITRELNRNQYHFALYRSLLMRSQSPSLPLSLYDGDPPSAPYFSLVPPLFSMGE